MTPSSIDALLDRHLSDWLGSGPDSPCLRERMADAIREAVAAQDKLWADGNATLRHERDVAIAALKVEKEWVAGLTRDNGILIEAADRTKSGAMCMRLAGQLEQARNERDALAAWKESALAVEASWNCQAVGKLLGLPLGSDIRAGIEPGIRKLLARLP